MLKTATLHSKDAVNYRKSSGTRSCGNCTYFGRESGTCSRVSGGITAADLCDLWEGASVYKEATQVDLKPPEVKKAQLSPDQQIVTFALNLEYLEAAYYTGLEDVKFSKPAFKEFAQEILANEEEHIKTLKETLAADAIEAPKLDIPGFFTAAARAQGLVGDDENWDPYADEVNFFLGGVLIEDVGVTAYNGAAPLIDDADLRETFSSILGTEAYHMGMGRSLLYLAGDEAREAHATMVKGDDKSQPIVMDGKANLVPAERGRVFARSPREVLDIVTLKKGATKGGFFPEGLNGDIGGLLK